MDHGFFRVITPTRFCELLRDFEPVGATTLPLEECLGRILTDDILSGDDIPALDRSCMDGYALRAADTFGASEGNPAYVELVRSAAIDEVVSRPLRSGECMGIATGGSLPPGADAVLMVEHTQMLGDTTVEVRKTVTPGENVMLRGEDVGKGQVALPAGLRLRPQDVGLMAAIGRLSAKVHRRPRCGIISTGDELVPVQSTPRPGQIRDVNSHTLACMARQSGALAHSLGLVPDRREALEAALTGSLEENDVVFISGGSSIGTRDLTIEVLESFADSEILAHGVSISPGKPTILARVGGKPVLGLPGQVTSAQIVMLVFGQPLLEHLGGDAGAFDPSRRIMRPARLGANLSSKPGREDYVRVRLEEHDGKLVAMPRLGKSGLLRTMLDADGLVCLPASLEGMGAGQDVDVWIL
ncbi:MAG: gephyrin-like molybdotransferase Glp [Desulfomicrobium sp.]